MSFDTARRRARATLRERKASCSDYVQAAVLAAVICLGSVAVVKIVDALLDKLHR
ncbi:hypothetical protein [Methylocystis echinoides]|uniref:hypothetical protein n=1 Tax=Methylocystis echinoides TaxID=29468 RepID=UPI003420EE86